MPLRELTDEEGVSWRVWDVHPRLEVLPQDGSGVERRVRDAPEMFIERCRERAPESAPGGGWLAFDSEEEKRRLSPVPEDWEVCPERRLKEYGDRAAPAPRPSP